MRHSWSTTKITEHRTRGTNNVLYRVREYERNGHKHGWYISVDMGFKKGWAPLVSDQEDAMSFIQFISEDEALRFVEGVIEGREKAYVSLSDL